MTIREKTERREKNFLSPYAFLVINSKGRYCEEPPCEIRTAFQRDRDRIIHSKAFRRLKDKTQVFLSPDDHSRVRLTHTLEVMQIARTIARALDLNEDLTEAIALGHDLGHTPFGHAGERALARCASCGFAHNEQSVRVVKYIEKEGKGLNLTFEVIDGILNHRTDTVPCTLEGGIVRISDKIAYLNHDIDDAQRHGELRQQDLPKSCIEVLGKTRTRRIDTMIKDVIANSADGAIKMSEEVQKATAELRAFLFEYVYVSKEKVEREKVAESLVERLFSYYTSIPQSMPQEFEALAENFGRERAACDYIAGMTDGYARKLGETIFLQK